MADGEPSRPGPFRERNGSSVEKGEIRRHIQDLLSEDFHTRSESVEELEKYGADAAHALVETLLRKSSQPHAMSSLAEALEEIGKPSVDVLIHALSHVTGIRRAADAHLLENLIETLGRFDDRRAAAPIAAQLPKFDLAIRQTHNQVLTEICEAAKVKAHRILADLGDRGGLKDLVKMLGNGRRRVRDGVVHAVGRVGDKRVLAPLVRLYAVEDDVSLSGAAAIAAAFREIVRRERVREDDPLFRELNKSERAMLGKLFPRARSRGMGGMGTLTPENGHSTPRSGPRSGGGR